MNLKVTRPALDKSVLLLALLVLIYAFNLRQLGLQSSLGPLMISSSFCWMCVLQVVYCNCSC